MPIRRPRSSSRHRGARPRRLLLALAALACLALPLVPSLAAAGPPFPAPVDGQAVYDQAGVLGPDAVARTEAVIDAVEARTGAEIVVYTQLVDPSTSTTEAEAQARALMDQWGVGRKGLDDGLVILFDIRQRDPCHGQVQLYAGPGFAATYLSNEERQAIYENDMLPLLHACEIPAALDAAMARIDAAATPEHAASLERARQLNAVLGLILAPAVLVLVVGFGLVRWWQVGRDPVYLDDPSILMPAPPPGLTPAAGAAIRDGSVGRRAMTAASLDLAVRGYVAFRVEEPAGFGGKPGIGIATGTAVTGDAGEQARMVRARSRPMDAATSYLAERLAETAGGAAYLPADRITELGTSVAQFDRRLEGHLVGQGWYRDTPSSVVGRWVVGAVALIALGIGAAIVGLNIPASGAVVLGAALAGSGITLAIIGTAMPARTKAGAVIRAMLEAYRRTLEKTMAMARSMGEVATTAAIPLIESPDDAVAWGVALGLQDEIEGVLQRSAQDAAAGRPGVWLPAWYAAAGEGGPGWGSQGAAGLAPGLMSASPVPDFGGMMAALGTIGSSPASSGSGGGFGGGGSGGGGGGAGGGF